MKNSELRSGIVDLLINKAAVKQDVADYAEKVLEAFRAAIENELKELRTQVNDKRIRLKFEDKGQHEFIVYIGSDVLVFQLHRNIFRLPDDHALWETDYLKQNGANGYFGMINIYNFLAESYEQNRLNDLGYLIGRVFMNHEQRCMVEGKGAMGGIVDALPVSDLTDDVIQRIVQCAMTFAIEFDLITPPYELVQQVSVMQIMEISSDLQMATGKRLGFKFSADDKHVF
ncbi:hypothetical protein OAU25_01495 [Crocinitomicaceae bacterium]|nr:hypothetical protein [Crocinitomicaceae bacterium]